VFGVPVESLEAGGEGDFGFGISDFGSERTGGEERGIDEHRPANLRNPKSEIRNDGDLRRRFDRLTNPVVTQVAAEEPALFAGWSADEWDELYSQFATGGALRKEGVRITAERINHDRETLYRLRVVLQTHLAGVAAGVVDTLYKLVNVEPAQEAPGEVATADSLSAVRNEKDAH
jgi:hypothetical protein